MKRIKGFVIAALVAVFLFSSVPKASAEYMICTIVWWYQYCVTYENQWDQFYRDCQAFGLCP